MNQLKIDPPPIRTDMYDSSKVMTQPWQRWFNSLYSYVNNQNIINGQGSNVGPQGATGLQGIVGPIGPQGMTGMPGINSSEAYANLLG